MKRSSLQHRKSIKNLKQKWNRAENKADALIMISKNTIPQIRTRLKHRPTEASSLFPIAFRGRRRESLFVHCLLPKAREAKSSFYIVYLNAGEAGALDNWRKNGILQPWTRRKQWKNNAKYALQEPETKLALENCCKHIMLQPRAWLEHWKSQAKMGCSSIARLQNWSKNRMLQPETRLEHWETQQQLNA